MIDYFPLHLIIIIALIAINLVSYITSKYNTFVKCHKEVEKSKSLVDVYLKKRYDLIPNLVECVKGYSNHEKETLTKITELRNSFANNANQENAEKLNKYYNKLLAIIEAYPQIKASENYLQLQKEITNIESEISASRRIYSMAITKYNTIIESFPNNIFATIFKFKKTEPIKFDVEDIEIKF